MPVNGGGEPGDVLWCDEYALTMAQSFFLHGQQDDEVVFELFVRTLPRNRGYLIAAGLDTALEHMEALHCSRESTRFLEQKSLYTKGFLQRLRSLRFTGDVDGIAEGTPVGSATPLLRIRAPRIEATLVEGVLLAIINHQTLVATKAARIVDAAQGRAVWDFSLRRVHGPHAALGVARAAYVAGFAGTATVAAGLRYGIPTTGTMAHHFVLAFGRDRERAAFEQFLGDFPGRAVLLVDTYDTLRGVRQAIAASRNTGVPLAGIRLDSGDIGVLARQARKLLDAAGMHDARIIASNDLDEYRIDALIRREAPVDAFGVGTRLGTSSDAPALQGVYKLVEQTSSGQPVPVMKHSRGKANDPGSHQVFRMEGVGDVIAMADEQLEGRPLLEPVMRQGARVHTAPSLDALRESCGAQRSLLPAPVRTLRAPHPWPVTHSPRLEALSEALSEGSPPWPGVKEVA